MVSLKKGGRQRLLAGRACLSKCQNGQRKAHVPHNTAQLHPPGTRSPGSTVNRSPAATDSEGTSRQLPSPSSMRALGGSRPWGAQAGAGRCRCLRAWDMLHGTPARAENLRATRQTGPNRRPPAPRHAHQSPEQRSATSCKLPGGLFITRHPAGPDLEGRHVGAGLQLGALLQCPPH